MRIYNILIFLGITLVLSCSKETENSIPYLGYNYAGLEIGNYVVFNVDSHHYNIPFAIDTLIQFQIKEVVDSRYTDLEGEEAFKIIRYRKEVDSTEWVLQDVWNAKISNTVYEKTEENLRYVKLIFPVGKNKRWDGNSTNNEDERKYEYTDVHQQEILGSFVLDSVTTVLQFEDINLVQEKFFQEKFATNIGLVYKKSVDIKNVFNSSVGLWVRDTGDEVVMTLAEYGK